MKTDKTDPDLSLHPDTPSHPEDEHPRIILLGQPNSGKSTIFNQVAGYRSITTNFPGATVEFTNSHIRIDGQTCDLIDLPGVYSLTALDNAAREKIGRAHV